MIPSDYDQLKQHIAQAGSLDTYLKMLGLYILNRKFPQSTLSRAAEDATGTGERTRQRNAGRLKELDDVRRQILSAK